VVTPQPTDLALHATLLMSTLDAWRREDRVEQVVRSHAMNRSVGTRRGPRSTFFTADPRVVIADLAKHAAEPVKRERVPLQERLLSLHRRGHRERRTRKARPHQEHVHPRPRAGKINVGLAPIDLGRPAGRVHLRHEHLTDSQAKLAAALALVLANSRLRNLHTVLIDQPPPDPLSRLPLLAGRELIAISHSSISSRYTPNFGAGRASGGRSAGGTADLQRLPDRPTMHPMPRRQRPDREHVPIPIPPDLLEQLHSRNPLPGRLRSALDERGIVSRRSEEVGPVQTVVPAVTAGKVAPVAMRWTWDVTLPIVIRSDVK
jgi:hypothetical protein